MTYDNLISLQNLFQAYSEFRKGKKKRLDLQIFERNLEDNLFALHLSLKVKTYHHGKYEEFFINDPKRRHIHKAPVADRVVHHLLYMIRILAGLAKERIKELKDLMLLLGKYLKTIQEIVLL